MATEREKFEAWIQSQAPVKTLERWPDNGQYVFSKVDAAWDAWQARAAEEAKHEPSVLSKIVAEKIAGMTPAEVAQFMRDRATVAVPEGLIDLLRKIRPEFGAVGSRDIDVREQQEQIDAAIAALTATKPKGWKAVHLKTGHEYTVTGEAINATNAQDGQNMVIYERDGRVFVREAGEFTDKFAAVGATKEPDWDSDERRCGGPGCDGNCCKPADPQPDIDPAAFRAMLTGAPKTAATPAQATASYPCGSLGEEVESEGGAA